MTESSAFQDLSDDARTLFDLLPSVGRIRNKAAMQITGWEMERLLKAKFELREKGLVEIKASFGGPFGKVDTYQQSVTPANKIFAEREDELYLPVQKWVRDEFLPDGFQEKDLFEVIISANKRPSRTGAGAWEVPDLISVSLKKHKYIPLVQMETICFEVKKRDDAFNPYGIFEAVSQSKFGNRAYYCFEWDREENFIDRADYQRIEQEADTHRIGLIQIQFGDEKKEFIRGEIILEAKALQPDLATLSSFIDKFFPEDVKERIIERTAHKLFW